MKLLFIGVIRGFRRMLGSFNVDSLVVKERRLFLALLVFRLINSLIIQTTFVPDEFWQSIEVAHKWTFGYGSLTWEWLPDIALRSPIYPLVISFIYQLASLSGLDSHRFIVTAPRVFHAILAAVADLHLYRLVVTLCGTTHAKWALFHQLFNWFTFFCAPRTLSNCLEWCLVVVGLANYPWTVVCGTHTFRSVERGYLRFIVLAIGCVVLRPTAAAIWAPLCLLHLYQVFAANRQQLNGATGKTSAQKQPSSAFLSVLFSYCTVGVACLGLSCLVDRVCFGRWTINQWNFILFNLLRGGSQIYGSHSWHWYLSQGLFAMLWTQTPFVLFGFILPWLKASTSTSRKYLLTKRTFLPVDGRKSSKLIIFLFSWTVFCYSCLAHKEFRFIFPLLPLAMYLCASATVRLTESAQVGKLQRARRRWIVFLLIAFTHAPLGLYTTLVHQRGTLDAVTALHRAIENQKVDHTGHMRPMADIQALVLMPCHSFPSVGYLHHNITLRHLSCDPDLSASFKNRPYTHSDEADSFYFSPISWLSQELGTAGHLGPQYIFLFDHLFHAFPSVKQLLLIKRNYRECGRFFHAHFLTHARHGNYVLVLCAPSVSL
ncbi:unnamed protein product [Dicrocoelium dendriticum]|nr:unnamed protein product [Dicrocoelium dendriticum]